VQDRWLVRYRDIFEEARNALCKAARGSPLSRKDAHAILRKLGVNEQFDKFLADTPGITMLEGRVCPWPDTAEGRAEMVLRVRGRPMRPADMASMVGRSIGTIANVMSQSPRFSKVDLESFGLAEWGLQSFDGIIPAIRDYIQRHGGVAHRRRIIDDLTARYPIAENSINVYLGTHHFVRIGSGLYRVRRHEDRTPIASAPEPQTLRNAFLADDRWLLRFDVNLDRLRGSGCPLPRFLADIMGLRPDCAMMVPVLDHSGKVLAVVRCTWPSQSPTIGSLAGVVDKLGLALGDYLFVWWDDKRNSLVALGTRHPRCDDKTEECVAAKIAALIGRNDIGAAAPLQVMKAVGQAIGAEESAGRAEIIRRLLRRQDNELIGLYRTLHDLEALRADDRARPNRNVAG